MPNGTVKFFNAAKGFGFITADEGGNDIFAPAASLVATGLSTLKTGQRVSFEAKPDVKGPKAVNIILLADVRPAAVKPAPSAPPVPPAPASPEPRRMTFYYDPADSESCTALDKLRAAGCDPRVVEYLTVPPAMAELKNLSLLLRNNDQSAVRKYDPLFRELCLDDRFISETEFWGAIVEHPSLINGPIVATQTKASICRSKKDVENFLAAIAPGWVQPAAKQKSLPEGILRLLTGDTSPPRAEKEKIVEAPAVPKPLPKPVLKVVVQPALKTVTKVEAVKKVAVKTPTPPAPVAKPKAKPKPAAAAKKKSSPAVKIKKPAARKPAKKAGRAKR